MAIGLPIDPRQEVTNFNRDPIDSVVALTTLNDPEGPIAGTGIIIGPNDVLTAAHNLDQKGLQGTVITPANQVASLPNRVSFTQADINGLPEDVRFVAPDGYQGKLSQDIGIQKLTTPFSNPNQQIGLLAYINPNDAINSINIETAGFPGEVLQNELGINIIASKILNDSEGNPLTTPNGFLTPAQTLVSANGSIDDIRNTRVLSFNSSVAIDTGQSGSGIWAKLDGDAPRVLGVVTHQSPSTNDNGGLLITKDVYDNIVLETTGNPDQLPENAIIGSATNDMIQGTFRRERIQGRDGDDQLFGAGADDRLEGGSGIDQALFGDDIANYDIAVTDAQNSSFQISHARGDQSDDVDTLTDIEFAVFNYNFANDDGLFVPLQVDPDDNTKLKDGPSISPDEAILDQDDKQIGIVTVESPAWMFDGDVDYTLNIGSSSSKLFNIAYIIDVSGSMSGDRISQAQTAYQTLSQAFVDNGIADNITFGVVPFNSDASVNAPLDVNEARSTIFGLRAGGGTEFGPALLAAQSFFNAQNNNATNIAYFLSDGIGSGASDLLQRVAEVRAFGIGGADLSTLQIIDSDGQVPILSDPSDLITEFNAATIKKDTIDRVDVTVNGSVVDTINPDQLQENTLGLTYKGSLENLQVSKTVDNDIKFDVVFKDSTPTVSLDYKITTGQEEVRSQSSDGTKEVIIFSVRQEDFTGSLASQEIIGNTRDNVIDSGGGDNIISGNAGNDVITIQDGENLVDGGAGIDTVVINQTQAEVGVIDQTGNVVTVGSKVSLIDVEFIQFTDTRFDLLTKDTAQPFVSIKESGTPVLIKEGNTGEQTITVTVELSEVATEDVVLDYTTRDLNATGDTDFETTKGQLTLLAGEQSGDIQVKILGDAEVEGDERFFLDISTVSGGNFINDQPTETIEIQILDDESAIVVPQINQNSITEGDATTGDSILNIELQRIGNIDSDETVDIEIIPAGDNPIDANDLVNGLTPQQVSFKAGESAQTLSLAIATDQQSESAESFAIQLKSTTGTSQLESTPILYTIQDNQGPTNPPLPPTNPPQPPTTEDELKRGSNEDDILRGRQGNDTLLGLRGDDFLLGGKDNDVLFGLEGNDTIKGGKGDDTLYAGLNRDNSRRNQSQSELWGGAGNDLLVGDAGDNLLRGGSGSDELLGNQGRDTLLGGRGGDRLVGGGQNDKLLGGSGDDNLDGGIGKDALRGGAGQDTLQGGIGKDILWGGSDTDIFILEPNMGTDRFADFSAEDKILLKGGLRFEQLEISQSLGVIEISTQASSELLAVLPNSDAIALQRQSFITSDVT